MPSIVGVETIKIFFLLKVLVRALASWMGSPSFEASNGYASTSSRNKYLAGSERKPTAELPPVITSTPPGNSFDKTVLPESLDLGL